MIKARKIKKIAAIALVVIIVITAVVYKVATTDKTQSTAITGGKSTEIKATSSGKSTEYDSIFKKDGVIDIKVEIPEEDFKNMLADPLAEEYKTADVTVNGTTIKNVGFRTKGNLTLRSVANSDSDRYSFRIKLDKYVDGQNLLGLDEFVVNNMYADPSYMREYLSYEALKEIGADVPETVFANVYVNGELYGFYLCVEAIDDSFLERNFGDNDGNLYKQEKGSTLEYSENGNYDSYVLKDGEDETKTDIKNLTKVLSEMPQGEKGNIESVLDVDSALKYIAANTVLGNYDSYSGNLVQNYYLYSQKGKFTVIPWDYNMSMAGFGAGNDATTIPIDEPVMGVDIKNLPLINNLLAVKEYQDKYHEYVKELLSYLENFENRVTELATTIRPYVEADPTKFYTMEQFEANIKYTEATTETTTNNLTASNLTTSSLENKTQVKADTTTSASQNTNGNGPNGDQGQRPQGGAPADQNGNRPAPPEGMQNGNMQVPPDRNMEGNMKEGPNGGMMGGSTSIVTYIKNRVENITKQLSGELPTTGNTTMKSNSMGGGKR